MIKAIFFDIDGTLVPMFKKEIPESTLYALDLARKKGIRLFVATGRAKIMTGFIRKCYDFDGYLTVNGQYCFDRNEKLLHYTTIRKDNIERLLPYIVRKNIPVVFVEKDYAFMNAQDDYFRSIQRANNIKPLPVKDPIRALHNDILQLNAYIPESADNELMNQLPNCRSVRWTDRFADIIPEDGGKNKGIDAIIDYYGNRIEETMAFGDGNNDIDMIRHAGIGVAMGNASLKVKENADYITDAVDEDGIYNALKYFNVI